jgi:peptide/nickel transport system permease protein
VIVPVTILFGVAAGVREGSLRDHFILIGANFISSLPEFATSVFLGSLFAVWLGSLPAASPMTTGGGWGC